MLNRTDWTPDLPVTELEALPPNVISDKGKKAKQRRQRKAYARTYYDKKRRDKLGHKKRSAKEST